MRLAAGFSHRLDRTGVALLLAVGVAFAGLYYKLATRPAATAFAVPATPASAARAPYYQRHVVSRGATRFAHAPTLVELSDGSLRAFWFGGSREGATDTAIYTATYAPAPESWNGASALVTTARLRGDLQRLVRKLGNPVAVRDARDRLWLFFVSVTLGGWSGSSINYIRSDDDGRTWSRAGRLVTSPFLNLSTLVKGAPFLYADGSLGLPVYHELIGKFGELLRLDTDARVLAKTRLSAGRDALQPVIVARSATEASGFMRYAGAAPTRVLAFGTDDAGRHWSAPTKIELPNPNAALDALALEDGGLLLAFNNTDNNRNDLSLAHSPDAGRSWRVIHRFEYAPPAADRETAEFSYPRLLRARDGDFHLVYAADKAEVRHVRFNRAWLESVIATSLSRGPRLDPIGECQL